MPLAPARAASQSYQPWFARSPARLNGTLRPESLAALTGLTAAILEHGNARDSLRKA